MAQTYDQWKKSYEGMTAAQQQQYNDILKTKSADYIGNQYMNQYNNTVYTPTTTEKQTNTFTYWDTGGAANAKQYTWTWTSGGGNFQYSSSLNTSSLPSSAMLFGGKAEQYESQNAGYLEKRNNAIANALYNEWKTDRQSIANYLNTFQDYRDYDTVGQNNTIDAIMKRMWNLINTQWTQNTFWTGNNTDLNSRLESEVWSNYNNANKWYSDLMWWSSNYAQDFDTAVKNKLQQAFWISDLDEFENRYPEYADSLNQYLESVRWVWDNTDPSQRQMLDGALQWIIGSAVGAWSDTSKLKVLESSIMDKFKDPDQIKQDAQNVVKLQTEWKSTSEIASEMWIPEDQVQQLILLANGLDSKAWEYYQLKEDVAKDITEPYDTKMQRLEEEKQIALDRANRNLEWLKEDFDTNMERQKQQNDINLHNADFLAGQYGYWMSRRWIEGLNYVATQAQQILDDLTKNYDRNSQEMADGIADIIRNWQRNNDDLMKASQDALTSAKNSFTSNMLAIQQQYGTVGLQAQQALANNVQSFIEQAETIYDNALTRQQQNLSNLITNVSNLNALAYNNLTLRNAKIQQFQSESMNLNRSQLQSLAEQLWMDTASYQDLVSYQTQAVANELNGYLPWAWVQFQSQIQSYLDSWYTPTQAMQMIMNSADFQAMQQAAAGSGDNWSMSGGIMYNKSTGEYMDLNGDEYWTVGDNLYNKRTGEVISWTSGTTNWVYQFTDAEVRTWDTIWNDINSIWHILNSEDWLRVWTYTNSNWYTYNVYATREDWIQATQNLLSRAYYWMTLWDAAQKWIGQWKDISNAKTVIKQKWLSLDEKLSDANVRKFIEAMWTWEWTLKKWETLDSWASNGRNLGGVSANNSNWPLTDYWVPISYDRSIKAMIPTQLMNTELELKKLESNIESLYKAWYSAEDAVLQYMWFNVNKEEDKELAIGLVNAVRSLSNENSVQSAVSYISQRINAGDYNSAIKKVENLVREEAKKNEWSGYFDESTARMLVEKSNALIELANSLPQDIWIFEWTFQKYLKKLKSSDASKLQTAIAYLTDEQVLKQAWSNMTEAELQRIKTRVPQIDERASTFMNKVEQLKQNALTNLNAWRQTYGLPALDEQTLLNSNSRASLYWWSYVQWRWWITAWESMWSGWGRM